MRTQTEPITIFSAKAATGTGNKVLVSDYRHVMATLSSDTHATFTIKFQMSDSVTAPDFASAQSPTNLWDYVEVKDLQDGSAIDGDTGVAFTDDDVRRFEVNTNGQRWLCATITNYTDGNIYLTATGFND